MVCSIFILNPTVLLCTSIFFSISWYYLTDHCYKIMRSTSLGTLYLWPCTKLNITIISYLCWSSSFFLFIYLKSLILFVGIWHQETFTNPESRTSIIGLIYKLVTVVKGDLKAPFLIATTARCRGGCYSIPWITPLYPWSLPYNAELSKVASSTIFFFFNLWYDSTWDWTPVYQTIGEYSTH